MAWTKQEEIEWIKQRSTLSLKIHIKKKQKKKPQLTMKLKSMN